MKVVSDTSAIIALSSIAKLDLIHQLYNTLYIPTAVYQEVVMVEETKPGTQELIKAAWITTQPVSNIALVRALKEELGDGESEAIALAIEMHADMVLMDERRGRKIAQRQGLAVIGVLGILVEAKYKGLIPALAPLLKEITTTSGFHISQQLYQAVLQKVGEKS